MQSPGNPSFYRGTDRIIGGVCSGLAEGFHVEALWVRLAFVVLAFVQGIGVLLYVVLWFLMPERAGSRTAGQNAFESMSKDLQRAWADLRNQFWPGSATASSTPSATSVRNPVVAGSAASVSPGAPRSGLQPAGRNPTFILGAILIVIGIAFLVADTHLLTWSVILPAALVAIGVALLVRNLNKRSRE
jgi:phage shock protein C